MGDTGLGSTVFLLFLNRLIDVVFSLVAVAAVLFLVHKFVGRSLVSV